MPYGIYILKYYVFSIGIVCKSLTNQIIPLRVKTTVVNSKNFNKSQKIIDFVNHFLVEILCHMATRKPGEWFHRLELAIQQHTLNDQCSVPSNSIEYIAN